MRLSSPCRKSTLQTTATSTLLLLLLTVCLPSPTQGQWLCNPLANETWDGLVQAISDSYRLAVLCPFNISGTSCPTPGQYPEGIVVEGEDKIIECDPDGRSEETENTKCIIDCPGRHFTVRGASSSLILTTVVLSGATNTSVLVEDGGRMEVVDSEFKSNSGADLHGGAIAAKDISTVEIAFSSFADNEGSLGGAIYAQLSTLVIDQSSFTGNEASVAGGAIALDFASYADVRASQLQNNVASSGGAIYVAEFGEVAAEDCTFHQNAAVTGGAIFNGGVATMEQSRFEENVASEEGGAMNLDMGSTTILEGNSFVNNGCGTRGPAIFDRYNIGVDTDDNTACGNEIISNTGSSSQCDGVFALIGRRRTRCFPFEIECIAPTYAPTSAPTSAPTMTPSKVPTRSPTELPTVRTDSPTMSPSNSPSLTPTTSSPTLQPSDFPTNLPSSRLTQSVTSFLELPNPNNTESPDPETFVPTNSSDFFNETLAPTDWNSTDWNSTDWWNETEWNSTEWGNDDVIMYNSTDMPVTNETAMPTSTMEPTP
eukprot:Nitzschia sp. Nitz4//scaffold125_size66327//49400//51280//NITZ4_006137-RA/size66327-augustus-gene-0.3-mRNA-1//1//CDS//3329534631//3950//frame0